MTMTRVLRLFIGTKLTGITVQPDGQWSGMWRVHQGDRVSEMVNLSRAKDAAMGWLSQSTGRGLRPGDVAYWRIGGDVAEGLSGAFPETEAA